MGQLFSFSGHVIKVLSMTILLTLLVGILSSLIVSLSLARPVKKLSDEVEEAQKNNSTSLRFSDTGIRELDQFDEPGHAYHIYEILKDHGNGK